MNSRERVLQSLNFVQPDRVPVDLSGHRSSGIMALAYVKLREYLGLPKRLPKIYDIPQQLAIVDEDVLDRFHIDVIEMGRGFCLDDADWHSWVLPDGQECLIPKWVNPVRENGNWFIRSADGTPIAIQKQGVLYFEQINWPAKDDPRQALDYLEKSLDNVMWTSGAMASPPGPVPHTPEGARYLSEGARKLREKTSRAIVGLFGGNFFEIGQFTFGMEAFYVLLGSDKVMAARFLDRVLEFHLKNLDFWLKAVGPYIDIILFGDDYGMQTGPQISPRMFRELFKPRHKVLWHRPKEMFPSIKNLLHSCGAISELLDDMIDAGLDSTNPVQTTAVNMAPEYLKKQFGRRVTFWGGGCDTQQVLRVGTPAEIREHVLHNLEILSPGGGFVFQQIHNILADVSPDRVVAMFDAVAEWNGVK
jgi:uroporphyrinogen decarboxylase